MAKAPTAEELDELDKRLAEWPGATEALTTLKKLGCDHDRLRHRLVQLRRASKTTLFSRAQLKEAATVFRQASVKLSILADWDQGRYLGLQDDPPSWFRKRSVELSSVAARIAARAADSSKKKPVYLGNTKRRIVEQVKKSTGGLHDNLVALLISAATGTDYDSEHHRKWRTRSMPTFKRPAVVVAEGITRD